MGIWLIALALVFNGVVTYTWNNSPSAPVAIVQDHHGGTDTVDCDVHSDDAVAMAEHSGQTQRGQMHNHLKCCATCTGVSLLPAVSAVPVSFSYRAAVFHTAQHDLVGHLVALDPDIPKSIV
jgi:hypothetical protein